MLTETDSEATATEVAAVANRAAGELIRWGLTEYARLRPLDEYLEYVRRRPATGARAIEEFDEHCKAFMQALIGLLASPPREAHVRELVGVADDLVDGRLAGLRPGLKYGPSLARFASKSAGLMEWSRAVVAASGVSSTAELVDEHARMAAGGIRFRVFLTLGASRGIDDLGKFFPRGEMPDGGILETFDALYAQVVQFAGDPRIVDDAMDGTLAAAWQEFVGGIREHYG